MECSISSRVLWRTAGFDTKLIPSGAHFVSIKYKTVLQDKNQTIPFAPLQEKRSHVFEERNENKLCFVVQRLEVLSRVLTPYQGL